MRSDESTYRLGGVIKSARKSKNLTQIRLAMKLGISVRYLKYIENSGQTPSYRLLAGIIYELDIPAEMAFYNDNKKTFVRND